MKLNLNKLHKLEKEYTGDIVSINTLQSLIDTILYSENTENDNRSLILAINTLKEMGILEETSNDKPDVQQLNS